MSGRSRKLGGTRWRKHSPFLQSKPPPKTCTRSVQYITPRPPKYRHTVCNITPPPSKDLYKICIALLPPPFLHKIPPSNVLLRDFTVARLQPSPECISF
jgi:hypothetical protein